MRKALKLSLILMLLVLFFIEILPNFSLEKRCKNGDDKSCLKKAEILESRGESFTSREFYLISCELKNAKSCKFLIENGGYANKDIDECLDLLCKADGTSKSECLVRAKKHMSDKNYQKSKGALLCFV